MFKQKVLEEGADVETDIAELELQRIECEEEAAKLTKKLVAAGVAQGKAKAEADEDVYKSLDSLEQKLCGIRRECSKRLNEAVESLRRCAAEVGKRLVSLEPLSSRSCNLPKGEMVRDRVRLMGTPEGRQQLRDKEAFQDGGPVLLDQEQPLKAPPYVQLGPDEWRLRGIHSHVVSKIGLRWLDDNWDIKDLFDLPRSGNKSGSPVLLKEKLILDLLSGNMTLQCLVSNDVAAAQPDIRHLSLRQLLRLRVRHLDFVPSGCGSNTVTGAQQAHENILISIDTQLFRQLGLTPIGECAPSNLSRELGDGNRHGREAVHIVAAAIVIPEPAWWCWWLSDTTRVFFHPKTFKCTNSFPVGGVLSLTDHSKRDPNEPTGHLRWFDWHVQHINSEDALPKWRPAGTASASASPSNAASCEDPTNGATGAGTAGALSPELLNTVRGNLKKTGGIPGSPVQGTPEGLLPVEAG